MTCGIEQHAAHMNQNPQVVQLTSAFSRPDSQPLSKRQAYRFTFQWFSNRSLNPTELFKKMETHLIGYQNFPAYLIECRLAEEQKTKMPMRTASDKIETAYHGTNMSCLYSIMSRRMLDIGPTPEKSTKHKKHYQFGVYCHKRGTKKKAANYMKYRKYKGAVIVAPLLQLNVRNYIACGAQLCIDP